MEEYYLTILYMSLYNFLIRKIKSKYIVEKIIFIAYCPKYYFNIRDLFKKEINELSYSYELNNLLMTYNMYYSVLTIGDKLSIEFAKRKLYIINKKCNFLKLIKHYEDFIDKKNIRKMVDFEDVQYFDD